MNQMVKLGQNKTSDNSIKQYIFAVVIIILTAIINNYIWVRQFKKERIESVHDKIYESYQKMRYHAFQTLHYIERTGTQDRYIKLYNVLEKTHNLDKIPNMEKYSDWELIYQDECYLRNIKNKEKLFEDHDKYLNLAVENWHNFLSYESFIKLYVFTDKIKLLKPGLYEKESIEKYLTLNSADEIFNEYVKYLEKETIENQNIHSEYIKYFDEILEELQRKKYILN